MYLPVYENFGLMHFLVYTFSGLRTSLVYEFRVYALSGLCTFGFMLPYRNNIYCTWGILTENWTLKTLTPSNKIETSLLFSIRWQVNTWFFIIFICNRFDSQAKLSKAYIFRKFLYLKKYSTYEKSFDLCINTCDTFVCSWQSHDIHV